MLPTLFVMARRTEKAPLMVLGLFKVLGNRAAQSEAKLAIPRCCLVPNLDQARKSSYGFDGSSGDTPTDLAFLAE